MIFRNVEAITGKYVGTDQDVSKDQIGINVQDNLSELQDAAVAAGPCSKAPDSTATGRTAFTINCCHPCMAHLSCRK